MPDIQVLGEEGLTELIQLIAGLTWTGTVEEWEAVDKSTIRPGTLVNLTNDSDINLVVVE